MKNLIQSVLSRLTLFMFLYCDFLLHEIMCVFIMYMCIPYKLFISACYLKESEDVRTNLSYKIFFSLF